MSKFQIILNWHQLTLPWPHLWWLMRRHLEDAKHPLSSCQNTQLLDHWIHKSVLFCSRIPNMWDLWIFHMDQIESESKVQSNPITPPLSKTPARQSRVLHGSWQEEDYCAVKYQDCTILGLTHNWHTGADNEEACVVITYRDTETLEGSEGALATPGPLLGLLPGVGGGPGDHDQAGDLGGRGGPGARDSTPALTHSASWAESQLCHHWGSSGGQRGPGGLMSLHWSHPGQDSLCRGTGILDLDSWGSQGWDPLGSDADTGCHYQDDTPLTTDVMPLLTPAADCARAGPPGWAWLYKCTLCTHRSDQQLPVSPSWQRREGATRHAIMCTLETDTDSPCRSDIVPPPYCQLDSHLSFIIGDDSGEGFLHIQPAGLR